MNQVLKSISHQKCMGCKGKRITQVENDPHLHPTYRPEMKQCENYPTTVHECILLLLPMSYKCGKPQNVLPIQQTTKI